MDEIIISSTLDYINTFNSQMINLYGKNAPRMSVSYNRAEEFHLAIFLGDEIILSVSSDNVSINSLFSRIESHVNSFLAGMKAHALVK